MPESSSILQTRYREAWTNPNAFATSLLILAVDAFGADDKGPLVYQWDPGTVLMEIEQDFNLDMPQANFDRLLTAIQIATSDSFYQSAPDFVSFCNILSGDTNDPNNWDPADASEVAWGITEALLIEPPDGDEPFTDEIRAYIGKVLDDEGIMNPPDVLRIALRQNGLDQQGAVANTFSDDPVMFGAIYKFEDAKTSDISSMLRLRLNLLAHQLATLPLRTGTAASVVETMLRNIAA